MADVSVNIVGEDNVTSVLDSIEANTKSAVSSISSCMSQLGASAYTASWKDLAAAIGIVLTALGIAFSQLDSSLDDVVSEISKIGIKLDDIKGRLDEPFTVSFDTEGSLNELKEFTDKVSDLEFTAALLLETSKAKEEIDKVQSAIEALDTAKALSLDVSGALSAAASVQAAIDSIPDVSYKTVIIQYQTAASPVMDFSEGIQYIRERMEALPTEQQYTVKAEGLPMSTGAAVASAATGGTQNVTFLPTINISGTSGKGGRELADELDRALADKWRYNRSELRRTMSA
jgi:hypothetical protein